MGMSQLSPNFFVGPQITEDELQDLAREGFTDIVCNRPDAEHPDGPVSGKLATAAQKLGMSFHYLPIPHGASVHGQARKLSQLTAKPGVKVLAYCRSGARSANVWSLASAEQAASGALA